MYSFDACCPDPGYSTDIDIKSPSSRFVRKRSSTIARQKSSCFLENKGSDASLFIEDPSSTKTRARGSGDDEVQPNKMQERWKQCGTCPLKLNSCHICGEEFAQEGTKMVFVFAEDPPEVKCVLFFNNLEKKTYIILCSLLLVVITIEMWIFYFWSNK